MAEAHTRAPLVALTNDPELLQLAATESVGLEANQEKQRPQADTRRIKKHIRRLGQLCKLGMKNEAAFESDLRLLQDQLAVARSEQSTEILGTQKALTLFKGVPTFIAKATDEERRAILLEVFDAIHLTPHQVLAIRPAAAYAELLKGARERLVPVSTTAERRFVLGL